MRQLIYLILVIYSVFGKQAAAQSFASANLPLQAFNLQGLYVDSVNNYMYAYGWILDSTNTFQRVSILRYNGIKWDTLSGFNNQVFDVEVYKDTLYACGSFTAINGDTTIKYVSRFNGTTWENIGSFDNSVDRLKVANDSLFALGWFRKIDNDSINSVAKWNGSKWVTFYNFPTMDFGAGMARTIAYYKNNYYVAGNFYNSILNIEDIAVYKNGIWQKVGQGLVGGNTTVNTMVVYKNELYFSGMIDESAGNIGHTILKWNDTTLSKVGDGLQNGNNQNTGFPQSWDLTVYNGYLYASGTFSFANHIPAQGLARWDGTQWCGYATDTISTQLNGRSVEFFQDTMYWASNLDTINGQFINKLLKYTGGNTAAVCSLYVGIEDNLGFKRGINVYPNPNTGNFTISINDSNFYNSTIKIYNITGQLILQKTLIQSITEVDLTRHPKGMYFVRVETDNNTIVKKIIYQ